MKKAISVIAICMALVSTPLWAHHAAEGMVDEEVYAMIDLMIADTPHADMVLAEDSETGMWEMTITTPSLRSLETLIDDGLLTYIDMLDNVTSATVDFNEDRSVTITAVETE